ncbi:MAG: APA family basic amino acid/polyamine antiporter, partial [Myxococcota bacterium]
MAQEQAETRLKRELGLWDVYAIATGATLSSGLFLLPGLAAVGAGSALPISYVLAGLLLLPGLVSKAELATAMPKAGGIYYFLDRSMGPLFGTMGGLGTWISLILKSAFALVGIGAYLGLFFPDLPMEPIAAGFAIFFGFVNLLGAKKSTTFQVYLLIGLLVLLLWFVGAGIPEMNAGYFADVFQQESASVISTVGLVVVSYMGLTKVASVAEEVKDPEKNLPLGMFLAFGTAILVYAVGTSVMVGVVGADVLAGGGHPDLTPVATVAEVLGGRTGSIVMTVAALLAFASVANAGILSASRYPLAMSRDKLLPSFFKNVGSRSTPHYAIAVTVALIILFVTVFDPTHIAELASAFQLVMFGLACLAVIVMRESGIESYDPGYKSPFYPWLHLLGILAPFWLIVQMGLLSTLFTGGLMIFGAAWYNSYARDKVEREGAILHVFERLGRGKNLDLDGELREIMKEKGLREADPFDEVIAAAGMIDAEDGDTFSEVAWRAADRMAQELGVSSDDLTEGFFDRTSLTMMA